MILTTKNNLRLEKESKILGKENQENKKQQDMGIVKTETRHNLQHLKNEIYDTREYPTIKKYRKKLENFVTGKTHTLDVSETNITDQELQTLFVELKEYKSKNLLENVRELCLGMCFGLKSVKIPPEMIALEKLEMTGCVRVKTVEFPKSLLTLKELSLSGCINLTSLRLPQNTSSIEKLHLLYHLPFKTPIGSLIFTYTFPSLKELSLPPISVKELKYIGEALPDKEINIYEIYEIRGREISQEEFEKRNIKNRKVKDEIFSFLDRNNKIKDVLPAAPTIRRYKDKNNVMKELKELYGREMVYKSIAYLFGNQRTLRVCKKTIHLLFPKHINVLSGFLATAKKILANHQEHKKDLGEKELFDEILQEYEKNLSNFIEQGRRLFYEVQEQETGQKFLKPKDNIVFFIASKKDIAFSGEAIKKFSLFFSNLCANKENFVNYDANEEKNIPPEEELLHHIKTTAEKNKDKQVIVKIIGHGGKKGDLTYMTSKNEKITLSKNFFTNLMQAGTNIHVDITSCNSGYKDNDTQGELGKKQFTPPNYTNNTIGSLFLDASLQNSLGGKFGSDYVFFEAFKKKEADGTYAADYDKDGFVTYHEAIVYRALQYAFSLTPTIQHQTQLVNDKEMGSQQGGENKAIV